MNSLPRSRIIIGYQDLFNEENPQDRLSLIQGISKIDLMAEISGLNYRLKPNDHKFADYSLSGQDRELFYFCGGNQNLYKKYGRLADTYSKGPNEYPLIFTRQTCLFALEEIVNSNIPSIENFSMRNSWESLLKYLLAVNTIIAQIRKDNREEAVGEFAMNISKEETNVPLSFENINSKIIVLNELNINSDQIYVPFRGFQFLKFITNHSDFGTEAQSYINDIYNMNFEQFIFELVSLYTANNPDKRNNVKNSEIGFELDTTFIYYPTKKNESIFIALSKVFPNAYPEKVLSIRKFPFFKAPNSYYLTDGTMLLEKCYSQFINDFWFDRIKGMRNEKGEILYDIRYYRAVVGKFFEYYIKSSLEFMMENAKHFKLKSFDDLLLMKNGQEIEFTDVYLRFNNKIFIAEAKSTGIYDKEKYSNELNEFYKDGREKFFDSFGMKQLVNAIKTLKSQVLNFDQGFPQSGALKLFPALIVNEKALQTPLMAQVFNNRFIELIKDFDIDNLKIAPLAILHISDFENMEEMVHKDPKLIWQLFERHASNTLFIPPFFHTLNISKVKPFYTRPSRLIYRLIDKYSEPLTT
jgi:hypothetical protein